MKKYTLSIISIIVSCILFLIIDFYVKNKYFETISEFPENYDNVYVSDVICLLKDNKTYRIHWESEDAIEHKKAMSINYFIVYNAKKADIIENVVDSLKVFFNDFNEYNVKFYVEKINLN